MHRVFTRRALPVCCRGCAVWRDAGLPCPLRPPPQQAFPRARALSPRHFGEYGVLYHKGARGASGVAQVFSDRTPFRNFPFPPPQGVCVLFIWVHSYDQICLYVVGTARLDLVDGSRRKSLIWAIVTGVSFGETENRKSHLFPAHEIVRDWQDEALNVWTSGIL
jgi:hypothetical protein